MIKPCPGHHSETANSSRRLAPLILNAKHHPGEEVTKRRDGSVDYEVELSSLEEIAKWVVGFGGKVRVVAPSIFAEIVAGLA